MGTSDGRTNGAGALPATPQQPRGGKPEVALVPFLGWFSLGLGVAQIAAPQAVARLIGLRDDDRSRLWMRVVGVRELAAAAGADGLEPLAGAADRAVVLARLNPRTTVDVGQPVELVVDTHRLHFFDRDTGVTIDT